MYLKCQSERDGGLTMASMYGQLSDIMDRLMLDGNADFLPALLFGYCFDLQHICFHT